MRFFIDGRVDIRPLTSQDKAHAVIPYDTISLSDTQTGILNNAGKTFEFTDAAWGTDLAWVSLGFIIEVSSPLTNFMTGAQQGFYFQFRNSTGNDIFFEKDITYEMRQPLNVNGQYQVIESYIFSPGFYSSSSQTLQILFNNNTGQTITAIVYVPGVAI